MVNRLEPRRVLPASDGTLRRGWWPGLETLHQRSLPVPASKSLSSDFVWLPGTEHGDLHLRCRVRCERGARVAVVLRGGAAVQLDFAHGEWQFGTLRQKWFNHVWPVETIRQPPELGRTYQLDLLVRGKLGEAEDAGFDHLRDLYGLDGSPAYSISLTKGKVLSTPLVPVLKADGHCVAGKISKGLE